jgi:manganese oxidase
LEALVRQEDPAEHLEAARARAEELELELPVTPEQARLPHPLVRPLVLRARRREVVTVTLRNEIRGREVGLHLVGGDYDVEQDDGSQVGHNPSSLVAFEEERTYTWTCDDEGVFPFHDGGNYSGGEDGTNVHGLFGALVVEPPDCTWRDPVTGRGSHGPAGAGPFQQLDGLYVDVLPPGAQADDVPGSTTALADHQWPPPQEQATFPTTAHREFVIFFHDEPEFVPAHGALEPSPCEPQNHAATRTTAAPTAPPASTTCRSCRSPTAASR